MPCARGAHFSRDASLEPCALQAWASVSFSLRVFASVPSHCLPWGPSGLPHIPYDPPRGLCDQTLCFPQETSEAHLDPELRPEPNQSPVFLPGAFSTRLGRSVQTEYFFRGWG